LNVDCIWNVTTGDKEINPLLLIPFVENAFKHVSRLSHENGYVNMQLEQNGNNQTFTVENSKSAEHTLKSNGSGLGLANVRKRLNILGIVKIR
jgi:LytS/YehU family sensor histidine kinase